MKIEMHVVTYQMGGYARDDNSNAQVAGAFTDERVANRLALVTHGKCRLLKSTM